MEAIMVVVFVVQDKYNLPPVNRETKKKTGAHTKGDEPRNANAEERVNVTHNLLEYSHRGGRPNIAARFPFDTRTSTVNKVVTLDAPPAEYSWNTPWCSPSRSFSFPETSMMALSL